MSAAPGAGRAGLGGSALGESGLGEPGLGVGEMVRAAVPLRQDGTFPDPAVKVGEVLIPAGTAGQIVDIGLYLNQHVVYAVVFETGRVVGCLARELVPAADPLNSPVSNGADRSTAELISESTRTPETPETPETTPPGATP